MEKEEVNEVSLSLSLFVGLSVCLSVYPFLSYDPHLLSNSLPISTRTFSCKAFVGIGFEPARRMLNQDGCFT